MLLVVLVVFGSCKKDSTPDKSPAVNLTLAISDTSTYTGDLVEFSIEPSTTVTQVKWNPGDGSGIFVTSSATTEHIYDTAGTYTVSATVFIGTDSTTLSMPVSVQDTTTIDSTYYKGIRITKLTLVHAEFPNMDQDLYPASDPRVGSDVYFIVSTYSPQTGSQVVYPRSSTKYDNLDKEWNLGNALPIIHYNRHSKFMLIFYDDDYDEGQLDDPVSSIDIFQSDIQSYEATKPTTINKSFGSTTISAEVEWF